MASSEHKLDKKASDFQKPLSIPNHSLQCTGTTLPCETLFSGLCHKSQQTKEIDRQFNTIHVLSVPVPCLVNDNPLVQDSQLPQDNQRLVNSGEVNCTNTYII